jgi:hypothetical protein
MTILEVISDDGKFAGRIGASVCFHTETVAG